jgi:inhibitor of cysteine peptidase
MKRFLSLFAFAAMLAMPLAGVRAATLTPGTLIKASGPAVYYYSSQGTRLVFPNAKTYFTWYTDFSNVVTITDSELAAIQIGGNVTYRPGIKMIKVTTDPKVYAVDAQGTLRWVTSEAIASSLYGANWSKQVDDVPDAFFSDYQTGTSITSASSFDPSTVTSQNTSPEGTNGTPTPPTTTTEETSESKTINVGDTFAITLDTNPSTGYAWSWSESNATPVGLVSDTQSSTSTLIGAGGIETFTFKALAEGSTDLVFAYARSWETNAAPTKRHTVHVTVNPAPANPSRISLSVQSEVQANEDAPIVANIANVQPGDKIDIAVNGLTMKSCGALPSCSVIYTIPGGNIAPSYLVLATLTQKDGSIQTASTTLTVVTEVQDDSIALTIPRTIMNTTSQLVATANSGPKLNATDIYIMLDGTSAKHCSSYPSSCTYQAYLSGSVGTIHTIYARVKVSGGLLYRSKTLTITMASNAAPLVTVQTSKTNIYATETVDVLATASDEDGISSITVYQDEHPIKTCTGVLSCSITAGPFPSLTAGNSVAFAASATDTLGTSSATGQTDTSVQDTSVTIIK